MFYFQVILVILVVILVTKVNNLALKGQYALVAHVKLQSSTFHKQGFIL